MAIIKIIGKKGSKAVKDIIEGTGIGRYRGSKKKQVDAIINYGLPGNRLRRFLQIYPSAKKIPILNSRIGIAKLSAVQDAGHHNILIPKSRLRLPAKTKAKKWIEKRQNSIGGLGIKWATRRRPRITGKYFQEYITNRTYELRVHAFLWTDNWSVQKRLGKDNEIAWNFRNGGYFQTVHRKNTKVVTKAIEVSKEVLRLRGMAFGAVDFIVDNKNNIYFIEVNAAPGFQELSKNIYIDAFNALQKMSRTEVIKYGRVY